MSVIIRFNDLVNTMQKYDLYQTDDEVGMALDSLKQAIDESLEVSLIKKLDTYLLGDHEELLVMYQKIKSAENQTEMIDYIDEVQTIEQFEYTFTCRDFIELIES